MMKHAEREPWMSAELEAELKTIAADGAVSCAQIQEFAAKHNLDITKMKACVDRIGLAVTGCKKLCA
jgi:hypothetical protein